MAGRKPLPTKLKVLRGNPGKRSLNKREPNPTPLTKLPSAPRFLDRRGATEWRRMARELVELGLLTNVDRAALAAYCAAYSLFCQASEELRGQPLISVHHGENGSYEYPNPLIAIRNKAGQQMKMFLTEFGMTPSSRSRIKVPEQKAEDPFEKFLADGGLKSVPPKPVKG